MGKVLIAVLLLVGIPAAAVSISLRDVIRYEHGQYIGAGEIYDAKADKKRTCILVCKNWLLVF